MSLVSRRMVAAGLGISIVAPGTAARAQATAKFPERPIKVVVPFPPGGGADFLARLLGQKMSESLGQPMIIDNKPGAGTTIANDAVAKAAPDGYTLLQVNRDIAISPSTYASLPYDTMKAFSWIGKASDGPFVFAVNPAIPAKTLAEFVAIAKSKPGHYSYGGLGVGGMAHLNVEGLKQHLGIDVLHVPYKGAGPALAAAVSGEVSATLAALTGAVPFIREGKLRPLAVSLPRRSVLLPDVPTIEEAGGGLDTVVPTFFGLAAPAGTPQPIIDRLRAELKRAMALPDLIEKLEQNGQVPSFLTGEELAATVAKDMAHFAKIVKAVGIPPQ